MYEAVVTCGCHRQLFVERVKLQVTWVSYSHTGKMAADPCVTLWAVTEFIRSLNVFSPLENVETEKVSCQVR